MRHSVSICLLLTAYVFIHGANAESANPTTPTSTQKPPLTVAKLGLPTAGSKMAAIETRYGTPKQKLAAVGSPPIVRWIYDRFTVYFESGIVIHSVVPTSLRLKSLATGAAASSVPSMTTPPAP